MVPGRLYRFGRILRPVRLSDHRTAGRRDPPHIESEPAAILCAAGAAPVACFAAGPAHDARSGIIHSGAAGTELRGPSRTGRGAVRQQRIFRPQRGRLFRAGRGVEPLSAHLVAGGRGAVLPLLAVTPHSRAAHWEINWGVGRSPDGSHDPIAWLLRLVDVSLPDPG